MSPKNNAIEPENVVPGNGKAGQKVYCFKCPNCNAIFTMMLKANKNDIGSIHMPCPVCKVSRQWIDRYLGYDYTISNFHYKWLRFIWALKQEKE